MRLPSFRDLHLDSAHVGHVLLFSPSSVGILSFFCSLFMLSSLLALVPVLVLLRRRRLTTPRHLLPLPSRVGNVCGVELVN